MLFQKYVLRNKNMIFVFQQLIRRMLLGIDNDTIMMWKAILKA